MIPLADVTAVVVDWNLPDHTVRCVESLVSEGLPPSRIVVVENGPTEETWSTVNSRLPGCMRVRLDPNVGFAKANNIGAGLLRGSAYLLVNNDAFVERRGSIAALLADLERPEVGIVVPRLLNPDLTLQPSVIPLTTPLPALARASGFSRLLPDSWQPHLSTHWSHGESREIQAAIGAVSLVGADTWTRLGGFRETSFMYAEDLDLCWRARDLGLKTWFCGQAEFVHLGGASSSRRWSTRERAARVGEAEGAMIRDHLPPATAAFSLGVMRAGLAARVALFTLLGREAAAADCRGSFEGLARSASQATPENVAPPTVTVVSPAES